MDQFRNGDQYTVQMVSEIIVPIGNSREPYHFPYRSNNDLVTRLKSWDEIVQFISTMVAMEAEENSKNEDESDKITFSREIDGFVYATISGSASDDNGQKYFYNVIFEIKRIDETS